MGKLAYPVLAYPVKVEGLSDTKDGEKTGRFKDRLNAKPINADTAFIERIRQILQSSEVESLIYSLIARSVEQTNAQAEKQNKKTT